MRAPEVIVPYNKRRIVNPTPYDEKPISRAERIDEIIHGPQVLKIFETISKDTLEPEVAKREPDGVLSRIVDTVTRALPNKAAAALLATTMVLGLPACAVNTVETTTTPPPPVTTNTLPQTTTTTEAPTTTTTTVPETTVTTIDPKEDITKATGDVYFGGRRLTELGFVFTPEEQSSESPIKVYLVKPLELKISLTDYQGELRPIYSLVVSHGPLADGSPNIREYMLDIVTSDPNETYFWTINPYTRNFKAEEDRDLPWTLADQEVIVLIKRSIDEKLDMGISIPFSIQDDYYLNCQYWYCDWFREAQERIPYNLNTIASLEKDENNGGEPETGPGPEPEMGVAISIYLFPPIGGW